ncbi:hypothetical protein N7495_004153 [Penicillium taxi]|uniref:uncharacterized protein n=1 Tax=Penicillium taxi TaxID=168475 RepID=UPI002545B62E|nr:uncharacterized protein N7495_004153 [Penicillium taxi]KAJ5899409.1 hypothetical protein N7495_004153 [Penicillium taxi]
MNTALNELRSKSSLLFGTCILAGIHITPSLHGSQMHQDIYRHMHVLLGQAQLASAASLDTIQSMLIFSMWDLRPARDYDHGSSWLLSGMAAMKMVITTPFEQLLQTSGIEEEGRAREIMRTWNLICLCQLQFSVGSGRPPVIASQYFDQCAKVIEFPSYNHRDELVLSGVNLYRVLWELTSSNSPVWPEMQKLRKSQEHIYNLDSSEPLRFAYSCAYLILARRTLQHMNDPVGKTSSEFDNALPFAKFAVHHAHQVLRLFLSMSEMTTYIHPAYENLLCSFAMVTLAEFSPHVTEVSETLTLMERVISHIQRGGKAEPVSRWSLNKIRQHASGCCEADLFVTRTEGAEELDPSMTSHAPKSSWLDNDWGLELDFPSLEEMFFGNVT